jgi:hypothetical protein
MLKHNLHIYTNLQRALGARHAGNSRVGLDGHAQRPGGRLKNRLGNVMAIAAIMHDDVQIALGVRRKGLPEIGNKLGIELADFLCGELGLKNEKRTAAEIERNGRKRFVHRERKMSITTDAAFIAQRIAHGLAQANADVLDRVVLIDIQIANGVEREIERGVFGQKREHVVEKPDAGGDLRRSAAVEVQFELNVGFSRFTNDFGCS